MKLATLDCFPAGPNLMELHSAFFRVFKIVFLAILPIWCLGPAFSQQVAEPSPFALQQAVQIALEKNPLRKAALADTKVASAEVREARSVLMPRLTFSETATRGNDPVYVFGSRLRQQRFTAADFDLNKLNTPLPFGKFSTRFGGSWNLFDSFSSWHGVSRAKEMNEAAVHQLERTDREIVFRVVPVSWSPGQLTSVVCGFRPAIPGSTNLGVSWFRSLGDSAPSGFPFF
jgi:hypothetical protein